MATAKDKKQRSSYIQGILGEIQEYQAEDSGATAEIALNLIDRNPDQVRRWFSPEALARLTASVKEQGILQPVLIRPRGVGRYELVAGERRFRAATEAGLTTIPARVRQMTDQEATMVMLVENLQREDINPLEETEGILRLVALRLETTVEEAHNLLIRMFNEKNSTAYNNVIVTEQVVLVDKIFEGFSQTWESFVSNRLPILKLPEEILEVLRRGELEYTKARVIARIKEPTLRNKILRAAVKERWSLERIRDEIQSLSKPKDDTQLKFLQRYKVIGKRLKAAELTERQKERVAKLLGELETLLSP